MASNRLPNEILAKIFRKLDNPQSRSDVLACRIVNHQWKDVVNELIGVEVGIGDRSVFDYKFDDKLQVPTQAIRHIGIKTCTVGTLLDEPSESPLEFAHPTCLRDLSFRGPIAQELFKSLILPLRSLSKLSIHFSALFEIQLYAPDIGPDLIPHEKRPLLDLPVLESFQICSKRFDPNEPERNVRTLISNSIILIDTLKSSKLAELLIDLPLHPMMEDDFTICILNCLNRNGRSLRRLDMFFCVTVELFGDAQIPEALQTAAFNWGSFNAVHFQRICLACGSQMQTYQAWKKLIWSQNDLKEVYFMNEEVTEKVTGVSLVTASLTKILFQLNELEQTRSLFPQELDCSIFEKCTGLTHLLVRGRAGWSLRPRAVVSNVNKLPKTLQVLSFREVHFPTSTLGLLVVHLPTLAKLRLIDIGEAHEHGMSPATLLYMIAQLGIQEFEVSRGFNKSQFRNYPKTNVIQDSILWVALKNESFHVSKVEGNGYSFKETNMFNYPHIPALRPNEVCNVVFN